MSNFSEALADAARSGLCQVLGSAEYINDALQRVGFFPFDAARRAIPNFWRNMLCDTDAPPVPGPPFTGGQCACVSYRVVFTRTVPGSQPQQVTSQPLAGPILGLVQGTSGNATTFSVRHGVCSGGVQTGTTLTQVSSSSAGTTASIVSIIRVDGQPDNCGNPPPVIRPPNPGDVTVNRNVTYNNSNNVSVTIPVVFVYARATLDVDANITIPFTANINGELNVTGNVNVDGTVNINIGTAGGGSAPKDPRKSPCDDIALPTQPVPTDPTGSEQPPQPDRQREETIIGVLVTVTALSNERASLIVQDDNPDIYAPSLGHVQFLCRVGNTSAAWTSDQPVKNRRNLIQCPWNSGAIAVRGTPQPGVTWTLTPIRGYAGVPVEYVQ